MVNPSHNKNSVSPLIILLLDLLLLPSNLSSQKTQEKKKIQPFRSNTQKTKNIQPFRSKTKKVSVFQLKKHRKKEDSAFQIRN